MQQDISRLLNTHDLDEPQGQQIDRVIVAGHHAYSRRREYRIYLPAGHDPSVPLPLVVVLHGCQQSHLDIQQIAAFDTIADRERCMVVYPYVTSYLDLRGRNCWGWWKKAHRMRGQGEVEDIWRIVEEVQDLYAVDASRIHMTGLSSGAAMAIACSVAYSDKIASAASVAGFAYGESASAVTDAARTCSSHKPLSRLVALLREGLASEKLPGLLVVQSVTDRFVSMKAAAGLTESWRQVAGLKLPKSSQSGQERGVLWNYSAYSRGLSQTLACLNVNGPPHGWMGGRQGLFSTPDAPAISELIWSHFKHTPASVADRPPVEYRMAS